MKIVQYNIYFGEHQGVNINERMKNLVSLLIKENPDVICLQEVLSEFYSDLCDGLEKTHSHCFPAKETGMDQKYGTVIFSKHPIKKSIRHKFEFTTMGRDLKLIMIENKDGETVYVCTSHFESEFNNGCMSKIYQYKRSADILSLLYQKTKTPIILCSDTNVCSESEKSFVDSFPHSDGWKDSWVENGMKFSDKITFDSRTNPILIKRYESGTDIPFQSKKKKPLFKARLDRILHLSDYHSNDFKLIGKDRDTIISDHYGVVCTFSKEKPEGRGDYTPIKSPEETKTNNKPYKKMF